MNFADESMCLMADNVWNGVFCVFICPAMRKGFQLHIDLTYDDRL